MFAGFDETSVNLHLSPTSTCKWTGATTDPLWAQNISDVT